jgi:hypothetical protein
MSIRLAMPVNLFVGSLPYSATSQSLSDFLWDWVLPVSVRLALDRESGRAKGFGFVQVDNPEDAVAACRASGHHLGGHQVKVSVARSRAEVAFVPRTQFKNENDAPADDGPTASLSFSDLTDALMLALQQLNDEQEFWVRNSLLRVNRSISVEDAPIQSLFEELVTLLGKSPVMMTAVHPRLFEHLVACLLSASGYRDVKLTLPSADGGVDIWASKPSVLGRTQYLIQCKRYAPSRKITRPEVQLVYGVLASSTATMGSVITTSTFTTPARGFLSQQHHRMAGLDGEDLANWVMATAQLVKRQGTKSHTLQKPPTDPTTSPDFRNRSW